MGASPAGYFRVALARSLYQRANLAEIDSSEKKIVQFALTAQKQVLDSGLIPQLALEVPI
jgi:hypothetical protein